MSDRLDPKDWPAARHESRRVDSLKPHPRNSKIHTEEQIRVIAGLITRHGWTSPVLIDAEGLIIAGHGRWEAAKYLGLEFVPCIIADGWSEDEIRAYIIADNKSGEMAGWNSDILVEELSHLGAGGLDLTSLGFGREELAELLASRSTPRGDPEVAPPPPEDPVTRPGDVWILGKHRLVCGDSTDRKVVKRALAGAKPRLMVTDPPYGVDYDANWRNEADRASGRPIGARAVDKVNNDHRADWRAAWAHFPGDVAYVWHGALHAREVEESLLAVKLRTRAQIVWVKSRGVISRGHYHWQHEPAFYAERETEEAEPGKKTGAEAPEKKTGADTEKKTGAQGAAKDRGLDADLGFQVDHGECAYVVRAGAAAGWRGGRRQTTVWFIEHVKSETGHSTQKPLECMARPIRNNSLPGDVVYEPFAGSGTTLIACEMEDRRCCAVEIDPRYCDVVIRRWQDAFGAVAVREADSVSFSDAAKGDQ